MRVWLRGRPHKSRRRAFLSTVTLLEIRPGIELARRSDEKKAEILEIWLEQRVKPGFAGRVLGVDDTVAERCGCLHAERPRFFRDGLILSTAAARELTVVTRHVKDFADCGVEVIDLWG